MKKYLSIQVGLTLIEVLIGITLMLILLSGMLPLFSSSLNLWRSDKNHTNIQQNARIAIDTMLREIRYASKIDFTPSSLTITKLNGERNTFQLGGGLHSKTLYILIDKSKATPVGGGTSSNPITENVVTSLRFTPYPEGSNAKAVIITIEATDIDTGKTQTIHTAIAPWNIP